MVTASVRRPVTPVRVQALHDGRLLDRPDRIVTEEPMEIRVHGPGQEPTALAVTMRTPGHDFELAVGFCHTEGLLPSVEHLSEVKYCLGGEGEQEYNIVTVALRAPVEVEPHRVYVASASCGICGKATLDQVAQECPPVAPGPVVAGSTLLQLPQRLRDAQTVFDATGGLHAAGVFTADGELTVLREDVGRHNALDKVVGNALIDNALPLVDRVLVVSGRVSFEIVQKAAMAGIGLIAAVSAPSSLAVSAADRLGQTLVGFLRDGRGNTYTHPERVDAGR